MVRDRDQVPVQRGCLVVRACRESGIREAQRDEGHPVWRERRRAGKLPCRKRRHRARRIGETAEVPPVGVVGCQRLRTLVGDGGDVELLPGLQQHRERADGVGVRRTVPRHPEGRDDGWPGRLREGVGRDVRQRRRIGRRLAGSGGCGRRRERCRNQEAPRSLRSSHRLATA